MTTPSPPCRPAQLVASIGLAGLAGAAGFAAVSLATRPDTRPAPRSAYLPDPRTCPGAVLPGITREDTCNPGYAKRVRHVTEAMKLAVYRRDGIDPTPENRRLYEVDHRIPLAVGGANELANLWAERWDGSYGAHEKDRLEALAYRMVCKGEMTIAEAQDIFRGDWTIEYKKLGLDRPRFGAAPDGEPEEDGDNEGFPLPE